MASTLTRNITLMIELEAYLKAQDAWGRFSSSSEIVRSMLRLMIKRDKTPKMGRSHAR